MSSTKPFAVSLRAAGCVALLLTVVFVGGCKRKIVAPPVSPATPEDIKLLTSQVAGPKKRVSFIPDIRVTAANRLKEIGPAAKEAIPALEKLAKDKDPEVKKVAEEALAKIKGS